MMQTADIVFVPVTPADYPLLRDWLARPHLAEWWGDPDRELAMIVAMVEGRDTTRPFIFHVGGEPAGYVQVWYVGHFQNASWIAEHPWLAELPGDAVGVDLSIGDPANLSKGLGSRVLRAFCEDLRRQGHATIVIDPDPANGRAIRAYRKAGFAPIPELAGRTCDTLLMRYAPDRPSATPPSPQTAPSSEQP